MYLALGDIFRLLSFYRVIVHKCAQKPGLYCKQRQESSVGSGGGRKVTLIQNTIGPLMFDLLPASVALVLNSKISAKSRLR